MANKYVDVSATYNGDGTTSDQAASAGAAGAWNNLRNVCIGTPGYGTVAAGDNIYVRSKNGTDLTETWSSATTFTTNGTISAPINLIFDNGTVWAAGGVFYLPFTSSTITCGEYFNIIGQNSLKIYFDAATNRYAAIAFGNAAYRDFIVETETYNPSGKWQQFTVAYSNFYGVSFNIYMSDGLPNYPIFRSGTFQSGRWFGCKFNQNINSVKEYAWFTIKNYYSDYEVYNCSFGNTRNTDYLYFGPNNLHAGWFKAYDCETGVLNLTPSPSSYGVSPGTLNCYATVSGGPLFDFTLGKGQGYVQWKGGSNYPTLNAKLPDLANTYWSWKIMGAYGVIDKGLPLKCPTFFKLLEQDDGDYTFAIEFLGSVDYGTPTKNRIWAEIGYTNSDGDIAHYSTYDISGGNCATSTAGWSLTFYGEKNYNKYKLTGSLTKLKKGRLLSVTLFSSIPSSAADNSDFFFIDPEITLS